MRESRRLLPVSKGRATPQCAEIACFPSGCSPKRASALLLGLPMPALLVRWSKRREPACVPSRCASQPSRFDGNAHVAHYETGS